MVMEGDTFTGKTCDRFPKQFENNVCALIVNSKLKF